MLDGDLFTDDDLPGWYADAACHDHPTEWWFPEKGVSSERAVEVCAGCPVRDDCLSYALDQGIDQGVWGGTGPKTRARLRRERRAA